MNGPLSFADRTFNCAFLVGKYVTIATMDLLVVNLVGRNPTAARQQGVHRDVVASVLCNKHIATLVRTLARFSLSPARDSKINTGADPPGTVPPRGELGQSWR